MSHHGLRVLGNWCYHQMAGGLEVFIDIKVRMVKKISGRFPKDPGCFRGGVDSRVPP